MLKRKSDAFRVVGATLGKITGLKRPAAKFVIHIVDVWLGMGCRYVFSNMARWGEMTERSYRNGFGKFFDWLKFNELLVKGHCSWQVIAAFDPCFI